MKLLNWPLPEASSRHSDCPTFEYAAVKAHCEGASNLESARIYEEMFGKAPKKNVPYWLVRLAIYYGALEIGHTRTKHKMSGVDKTMAACVQRLDENELRTNKVLWHHMYLHDVEDKQFDGRELVS